VNSRKTDRIKDLIACKWKSVGEIKIKIEIEKIKNLKNSKPKKIRGRRGVSSRSRPH
jgi:hypothetical protein